MIWVVTRHQYGISAIAPEIAFRRKSPIGFFNAVIPTQNLMQFHNPEGNIWHPTSRAHF